jgi:hypothetical protein
MNQYTVGEWCNLCRSNEERRDRFAHLPPGGNMGPEKISMKEAATLLGIPLADLRALEDDGTLEVLERGRGRWGRKYSAESVHAHLANLRALEDDAPDEGVGEDEVLISSSADESVEPAAQEDPQGDTPKSEAEVVEALHLFPKPSVGARVRLTIGGESTVLVLHEVSDDSVHGWIGEAGSEGGAITHGVTPVAFARGFVTYEPLDQPLVGQKFRLHGERVGIPEGVDTGRVIEIKGFEAEVGWVARVTLDDESETTYVFSSANVVSGEVELIGQCCLDPSAGCLDCPNGPEPTTPEIDVADEATDEAQSFEDFVAERRAAFSHQHTAHLQAVELASSMRLSRSTTTSACASWSGWSAASRWPSTRLQSAAVPCRLLGVVDDIPPHP